MNNNILSGHSHSMDVGLAVKFGMAAAHLYNHFFYWIKHNRIQKTNFIEGKTWTYQTVEEMSKYIPYLSIKQIRMAIDILLENGLIIKGKFNKSKMDHTTWYALPNESDVIPEVTKNYRFAPEGKSNCQPGQLIVPSKANLSYNSNTVNIQEKEREDSSATSDNRYKVSLNKSEQSSDVSLSSPSSKKEKKIPKPSSEALRLTDLFCKNLKQINPKFAIPEKLDLWASSFDLMIGKDGHTSEEIIKVFDYLLKESKIQGKGFYWCDNIKSPAKLKEKFSDVWQAIKRSKEKKAKHSEIVGSLNDNPEARVAQGGVVCTRFQYEKIKAKGGDMTGFILEEETK